MKKTSLKYFVALFMAFGSIAYAQTEKVKEDPKVMEQKKKAAAEEKAKLPKPYNSKADAQKDIEALIIQAKKENKNIMIQAGGNWCIWCLRFNQFVQTTPELKGIVDKNYVYYHLNYSPDNKNEKTFAKYINIKEQQFYPFFIILDKNGNKINIQQSDVLEDGNGYSKEKVKEFLEKGKIL